MQEIQTRKFELTSAQIFGGAFLIFCIMLVAVLGVHWPGFFAPKGIEYPMSLLAISLALLISGGGKASIDLAMSSGGRGRRR